MPELGAGAMAPPRGARPVSQRRPDLRGADGVALRIRLRNATHRGRPLGSVASAGARGRCVRDRGGALRSAGSQIARA